MDGGAAKRIATLAVGTAPGPLALEVGAGTGALTLALLAAGAELTVLDVDDDMIAILRERGELARATVRSADALDFDYEAFAAPAPATWIATGNLPYNIATPLVLKWIELPHPPSRIVVMIQRDVADRFVARPSTPAYGSLTLALAYRYDVRRAFTLGPSVFWPRPNVESAVVVLERRPEPAVPVRDPAFLMRIVRAGFAYRRKTLANSLFLAEAIDRARTRAALERRALNPEIRAEQIGLDAFGALADELAP